MTSAACHQALVISLYIWDISSYRFCFDTRLSSPCPIFYRNNWSKILPKAWHDLATSELYITWTIKQLNFPKAYLFIFPLALRDFHLVFFSNRQLFCIIFQFKETSSASCIENFMYGLERAEVQTTLNSE